MARWLLLIFVGVPIIEIVLFVKLGGAIGVLPTLAIILLTAILGGALVRRQGLRTLDRLRASLQEGGDPVGPIAHHALILVAGLLLILPGFLTDTLGLLLLIPALRTQLIRWGASRVTVQAASFVQTRGGPRRPEVIEAEYEILDDVPPSHRQGRSGWTRQP